MKVIERMIRDCREGLNKRKPIIWIKTSEIEIVRRIVSSECFTSISRHSANGWELVSEKETRNAWRGIEKDGNVKFLQQANLSQFIEKGMAALSDSAKAPPFVLVAKADTNSKSKDNEKLWSSLLPYIDAHSFDLTGETPLGRSVVILFGEKSNIPNDFTPYCHIVDEPYPKKDELKEMVYEKLGKIYPDDWKRENIINEMLGFSLIRAEQIVDYIASLFGDEYTREKIEEENANKKNKKRGRRMPTSFLLRCYFVFLYTTVDQPE